jgi:hypothetical protein
MLGAITYRKREIFPRRELALSSPTYRIKCTPMGWMFRSLVRTFSGVIFNNFMELKLIELSRKIKE